MFLHCREKMFWCHAGRPEGVANFILPEMSSRFPIPIGRFIFFKYRMKDFPVQFIFKLHRLFSFFWLFYRVESVSILIAPQFCIFPVADLCTASFGFVSRLDQGQNLQKCQKKGVKNLTTNWLKFPPTVHPAKTFPHWTDYKNSGYGLFFWYQLRPNRAIKHPVN